MSTIFPKKRYYFRCDSILFKRPFWRTSFDEDIFVEIIEKPEYKHFVNSGINVFSKKSIEKLKDNTVKMDLPEFVNTYQNKKSVSKFDIKDYWIDVNSRKFEKSYE